MDLEMVDDNGFGSNWELKRCVSLQKFRKESL